MNLSKEKITIGIVACTRDIEILDRLLKSIKTYTTVDQIREILVVWNDHENKQFKWLKKQNYGLPLVVKHNQEIDDYHKVGANIAYNWYSQQYFKLKLCEYSKTVWTLIHDCKDYYHKPTDFFADCITEDNRARMATNHFMNYPKVMQNFHGYIQAHYGNILSENRHFPFDLALMVSLDSWYYRMVPGEPARSLWTQTPFWFHTETVNEMNKILRRRFGGFFPWIFGMVTNDGTPIYTEFLLYNGYVMSKNQLDQLYADIPRNSGYLLNYHQSKSIIDSGQQGPVPNPPENPAGF